MTNSVKRLILLVGLPGSGKSTFVREHLMDVSPVVCSADGFFTVGEEYRFFPSLIAEAHQWCQARAANAMSNGEPVVVIDNTSLSTWEREPYMDLALQHGYEVGAVVFPVDVELSAQCNTHGVPEDALHRMAARLDLNPGVYVSDGVQWLSTWCCNDPMCEACQGGLFNEDGTTAWRKSLAADRV